MKISATEGETRFIPSGEIWMKAWKAFRSENNGSLRACLVKRQEKYGLLTSRVG